MLLHPDPTLRHIGASLDQICITDKGEIVGLEIKCPYESRTGEPVPRSVDDISTKFLIQIQIQLAVLPECTKMFLHYWTLNGFSQFEIPPHIPLQKALIKVINNFEFLVATNKSPRGAKPGIEIINLLADLRSQIKHNF